MTVFEKSRNTLSLPGVGSELMAVYTEQFWTPQGMVRVIVETRELDRLKDLDLGVTRGSPWARIQVLPS